MTEGGTWISAGTDPLSYTSFKLLFPPLPVTVLFCKLYSSPGSKTGYGRKMQLIPHTMDRVGRKSAELTSG